VGERLVAVQKAVFTRDVVDSLLSYAKMAHPNEGILLIRGKARKGVAEVTSVMIPPGATHARSFSGFNWFMIPLDSSYLGVAHSHPSGYAVPSHEDLIHATGRLMVIMGYPYEDASCLGVFTLDGKKIPFEVKEGEPRKPLPDFE
jgi:proteasome lid subunit RPN8/RPN11